MVRHLGDPEATRAAEALSPKSYPVFVDFVSAVCPLHAFDTNPEAPSTRTSPYPSQEGHGMGSQCTSSDRTSVSRWKRTA